MKYIVASLCILLVLSCSVQKRRYQKGFYVSRDKSVAAPQPIKKQHLAERPEEPALVADVNSKSLDLNLVKNKILIGTPQEDSCDVIIFRDGTELRTRIIEVGTSEVRYKRCDNPSGPLYVSRKADLFMLRYSNGMKELIKEEAPKPQIQQQRNSQPDRDQNYNTPQKPSPAANSALIFGILAMFSLILSLVIPYLFISCILSAINAIRSARKFFVLDRQEPGVYAGRGKTVAGLTLALVTLALIVFFIILLILFI